MLLGSKKLAEGKLDAPVRDEFRKLVAENIGKLVEITNKIQRITQYQTKDYVQGKKIFDIDAASRLKVERENFFAPNMQSPENSDDDFRQQVIAIFRGHRQETRGKQEGTFYTLYTY
ncbi:MAG: hypothetical protein K9K88_12040 [Desulfobacterales bacterium]|nr:hypothetical protein [Desulfobacterales bacterium]